jgi:hypothetical protein
LIRVKKDLFTIRLGSLHKTKGTEYKAKEVFINNKYSNEKYHNLALIQLDRKIVLVENGFKYTVNGICLPEEKILNENKESARMSGWGQSSFDESLKYAVFDIKPPKECNQIQRNMICVSADSQTACIVCYVLWGKKVLQILMNCILFSFSEQFWFSSNTEYNRFRK